MERKNREKEMASVLLSSLCFPSEDVVTGFVMLVESAEGTTLDIPVADEDLAMFLARAVVDEVLTPYELEEIGCNFPSHSRVVGTAVSLLRARLSRERILRCWGCNNGGSVEDVKEKIGKLLVEYGAGGNVGEVCRCIKELGMPFFHHEVVKRCVVMVMERRKERMWGLLRECFGIQLITMGQMGKRFARVAEAIDDLALDVPDVKRQLEGWVRRARDEGWLDGSFAFGSNRVSEV
ncbi:MA3 domain-containing protein [Striga hermonthica]|uniref:MA3 domain-containing protein n=1 Tax=Striga hermonthica TaxID=68872 RepID=A0A9N7RRR5_STRHE|nr:MA3 domain-containing protein [Striga hermonthica]